MTKGIFIDGQWLSPDASMEIYNPYTGNVIESVACAAVEDVRHAVTSAARAFESFKTEPSHIRAGLLSRTAAHVGELAEEFAGLITAETGKPISASRREVSRCVNTLTLSAEEAKRISGETLRFDSFPGGENRLGYYDLVPRGVIAAITPFNDPLNLVAHKVGPALAAGNTVVLKPAEQAPLSAIRLLECFLECGLPPGVINLVTGRGGEFGDALVGSDLVSMVSFTGSSKVGADIARCAGVKKLSMELGANSPVIVMADCDLPEAVDQTVLGAFSANGQNCIGVQRVLVEHHIYQAFRDAFIAETEALPIGNPLDENTIVGPLIDEHQLSRVEAWVNEAQEAGATLLAGGSRNGPVYQPAVLENVAPDATLNCEEVFGPVVILTPFEKLSRAIEIANIPAHTIHAAIFTGDVDTALRSSRELDVAGVIINDSTDYRLDAMPFGGAKQGSMGREGVKFAIQEMTQTRVVCFKLSA